MNYKKIIEEYLEIQVKYRDSERSQEHNYRKLTQDIKESLENKSSQEYSQYFSELFDIWLVATEESTNINIFPFDDQVLNKKYKEYKGETSAFSILSQDTLPIATPREYPIAASRKGPIFRIQKHLKDDRKERVAKLLDFSSISQTDKLYGTQKIIEYVLGELWSHIFQNRLVFLNLEDDKNNCI